MPGNYHSRLATMESWYEELAASDLKQEHFLEEYAPHRLYLQSLAGAVVDIGGGAGIAARFLRPDVRYVVVDPSETWRSPQWLEFGKSFRGGAGPEPQFVAAPGEALPFPDRHFDVALSFWSLNHVSDPRQCIVETARVLKPGGTARLVLEDVSPSWPDLLADGARRVWARLVRTRCDVAIQRGLLDALALKIRGRWPLQDDHIRIADSDLRKWMCGRLTVRRRHWVNGYLTYDLAKP